MGQERTTLTLALRTRRSRERGAIQRGGGDGALRA